MIQKLSNKDIPFFETRYLRHKDFARAVAISLVASAIIALSFYFLLKNQANHITFEDSGSGGIKMVYSYVSDEVVKKTVFSIFGVLSSLGIGLAFFNNPWGITPIELNDAMLQPQVILTKEEVEAEEQRECIRGYVVTIATLSVFALLITMWRLNGHANGNYDVNISNPKVIEYLKSLVGRGDWHDALPALHMNSWGHNFRVFQLSDIPSQLSMDQYWFHNAWAILACSIFSIFPIAIIMYVVSPIVYGVMFLTIPPLENSLEACVKKLDKKRAFTDAEVLAANLYQLRTLVRADKITAEKIARLRRLQVVEEALGSPDSQTNALLPNASLT